MHRHSIEPLALKLTTVDGARDRLAEDQAAILPALAAARDEMLAVWQTSQGSGISASQRLLDAYRKSGGRVDRHSQLGQILAQARLLADQVERVVVIAGQHVHLAAQAILESCAHPHHNELSRAERGGYPRIYLESGSIDNDALAGLLDLLMPPRPSSSLDHRWALISVDDGTVETALKTRMFAQALENSLGSQRDRLDQLLVRLPRPSRSGGTDPFTSGLLLPAALAGLDVVALLSGAVAAIERLIHDSQHDSPALQLAGLCHLAGPMPGACRLTVWSRALESVGRWHDRLRQAVFAADPVGSSENSAKSATDLHRHSPPEKIGRTPVVINLVAGQFCRDRLAMGDQNISETMQEAQAAAIAAQQAAGQLAVELRLPRIDEPSIGQLLQLLLLATAIETRLALNSLRTPTSS